MRRLLALLATCAAACAAQPKMEWPPIPAPEPLPAEPEVAAGGPLIPSNAHDGAAPAPAAVRQTVVREIPPDVPRDGKRYLVLRWPLPATGINSLFGNRRDPLDGSIRRHAGVDLEADYGAVVSAAGDGFVVWAGWTSGHGRMVIIEHAAGYQTLYSHLSQVLALPNTPVVAGQAIGLVGNSGRSTGPHLHLEVRHDGVALDPLDLLGVPIGLD
jgi:murein DD-endopeptidase MepM/ murein hydrolase activator NlpD